MYWSRQFLLPSRTWNPHHGLLWVGTAISKRPTVSSVQFRRAVVVVDRLVVLLVVGRLVVLLVVGRLVVLLVVDRLVVLLVTGSGAVGFFESPQPIATTAAAKHRLASSRLKSRHARLVADIVSLLVADIVSFMVKDLGDREGTLPAPVFGRQR